MIEWLAMINMIVEGHMWSSLLKSGWSGNLHGLRSMAGHILRFSTGPSLPWSILPSLASKNKACRGCVDCWTLCNKTNKNHLATQHNSMSHICTVICKDSLQPTASCFKICSRHRKIFKGCHANQSKLHLENSLSRPGRAFFSVFNFIFWVEQYEDWLWVLLSWRCQDGCIQFSFDPRLLPASQESNWGLVFYPSVILSTIPTHIIQYFHNSSKTHFAETFSSVHNLWPRVI